MHNNFDKIITWKSQFHHFPKKNVKNKKKKTKWTEKVVCNYHWNAKWLFYLRSGINTNIARYCNYNWSPCDCWRNSTCEHFHSFVTKEEWKKRNSNTNQKIYCSHNRLFFALFTLYPNSLTVMILFSFSQWKVHSWKNTVFSLVFVFIFSFVLNKRKYRSRYI